LRDTFREGLWLEEVMAGISRAVDD